MRLAVKKPNGHLTNGKIKIGALARRFGVSVDLIRLYEKEGLLLSVRSPGGTRYYTQNDFVWVGTILRLVREARLNFAGIRRLLALLPCWEIRQCAFAGKKDCPVIRDAARPCWANRACCAATVPGDLTPDNCYFCPVYRSAPSCENLKALLAAPAERSSLVSISC